MAHNAIRREEWRGGRMQQSKGYLTPCQESLSCPLSARSVNVTGPRHPTGPGHDPHPLRQCRTR
jgi:hypothetical protein